MILDDEFEWYTFVCEGCGEETFVGKSPEQTLEDFGKLSARLYGDPPVCTSCQQERRTA